MSAPAFNREKFIELILYVASKTAGDRRWGDIKLNKVLYFADFEAYRRLGHPMTGARQQKLELGPAPVPLVPVRKDLEAQGYLAVTKDGKRTVTAARREPDMSEFSDDEIAIVDQLIERFRPMSAMEVSGISHRDPGWNLVEVQQDIPYAAALISTEPPAPETVERARTVAARLGW
jgi:hypothetical protein